MLTKQGETFFLTPGNTASAPMGPLESASLLEVAQSQADPSCLRMLWMQYRRQGWNLTYLLPSKPLHWPSSAGIEILISATTESGSGFQRLRQLHGPVWLTPRWAQICFTASLRTSQASAMNLFWPRAQSGLCS